MEKSSSILDEDRGISFLDKTVVKTSNILSYLFLFIVAISFYEIIMRYLFNLPTIWVHESASFLGGALFVLGGSYVLATNKHVRVVIIYDIVSKKTRAFLNLFHHIMGMIFCSLMAYASWTMTEEAWISPSGKLSLQTSGSAWDMPLPAILKAIILVIFCIMFFQFFIHFIIEIKKIGKNNV